MTLTFRPFTLDEYLAYRSGLAGDYAEQMIELGGTDPETAREMAASSVAELMPPEGPLDTHRFTVLEEHGERVGIVWVGPGRMEGTAAWIYDVAVEERHRGRGFGRALMIEAERASREAGDAKISLNVFGGNVQAIGLYLSLGFTVDAQQMSKPLAEG